MSAIDPAAPGQPKILFIHIAKTAGSSVVEFFRRRLPPGTILSHGDFMQYSASGPLPEHVFTKYQFISGHLGYQHLAPYLHRAYSFTFLRDPVERALSFFKFCLHPDMQRRFAVARAARDLGIDGFLNSRLPEVVEMLDNLQTWQLASMYWQADRECLAENPDTEVLALAKKHLGKLSRVGLTETFDSDFQRILSDLRISGSPMHILPTPEPLRREQLAPGTVQALRERLQLDYQLYDFAKTLPSRTADSPVRAIDAGA
ncbi:MAG: sulfotransferase family 2 domain-containing protein [Halieaceae bacterium]|nr:sulfotransferase family 2 domain-containing protein [Halieaceae bacterium]